jgi:hypothetical protein
MYTEQLTQGLSVVGATPPQNMAVGTDTTITNIDMSKFRRLLVIVQTGTLGGSGTVDAKLRESKTSGGTYQDISGAGITQITANNKVATIEVRADELDAGYQFVQLSLTVGTATSQVGAIALGGEAVEKPGKASDIAAVTQRLVV